MLVQELLQQLRAYQVILQGQQRQQEQLVTQLQQLRVFQQLLEFLSQLGQRVLLMQPLVRQAQES